MHHARHSRRLQEEAAAQEVAQLLTLEEEHQPEIGKPARVGQDTKYAESTAQLYLRALRALVNVGLRIHIPMVLKAFFMTQACRLRSTQAVPSSWRQRVQR
jgi:hypothetical protein